MSTRNLSPAAERLLSAAMALFAAKGYDRTTVGEIQESAGLTFGSGALYKHFTSKDAVLAEGMERFVAQAREERQHLHDLDDVELPQALEAMARQVMFSFARDADTLRIVWRDLSAFPELQELVRTERIRASFDDLAAWLATQQERGRVIDGEPAALAAVALSSLVFFQLLSSLLHDTPAGLGEEEFVTAWSSVFAAALGA
jgi:AcrR family transcriptional regulator